MRSVPVIALTFAIGLGLGVGVLWAIGPRSAQTPIRLSVFEPHAGGCGWYILDIARHQELPVVHFPTDCPNVQAAWSQNGRDALVWFSPQGYASREDMLFRVDVPAQKLQRLSLPEIGEAQSYAFDAEDRVVAFTEDQQVAVVTTPPAAASDDADAADAADAVLDADDAAPAPPPLASLPAAPAWIDYQGQRYPTSTYPGGQDVLVHALLWDGAAWQLEETTASRCCEANAPGVQALASLATILRDPRRAARLTSALLTRRSPAQPVEAAPILASVLQELPTGVDPRSPTWRLLDDPAWPRALLFRGIAGDGGQATGVAFFTEHGQAKPLPGFTFAANDVLQPMIRGTYLLIADWASGTDPHLYDMLSGDLVYSSQVAFATTFWPDEFPAKSGY